nr:EOG090X0MNC [Macrothrix elegans]
MPKKKDKSSLKSQELELVAKANAQKDPLEYLKAFHSFDRNGLKAILKCSPVSYLDKEVVEWMFDLIKRNMKDLYEKSAWGWDEKQKFIEMTESSAWYLIAFTPDLKPLGFSHFRFDMDYGYPVLYCYELQLEDTCRRKGLGKFMLQILELMAFRSNLVKVVLTVFMHNPEALQFFKALGYKTDETNPENTCGTQYDYVILSKQNLKAVTKTPQFQIGTLNQSSIIRERGFLYQFFLR